jgi:hypothetical protein
MITNSANKVIVAGNGVQTSFAFSFVGVAASDLSAIYTDANGNETVLAQGPGSTQFQVSLNTAQSGSLWGVGGSVTYNPGGTPIAIGTTLTIVREIAFTQSVSLQNQSSYGQYAQAAEQAMDLLEMQIQQIAEAQNRVLSAPIVDPSTINLTLPPAAQRANTGIAFDNEGNVIAGTLPVSGIISTAMQPVVDAASIAAARTALGLGTMATLTPNFGLQENVSGAGDVDVNFATDQDAANQTVVAAFHLTQRFATGALSYSLPRADTLWNGFGFWVMALAAPVTFAPNSNDNFPGLAGGASLVIPVGSQAYITTNAATSGTWWATGVQRIGLNSPLNLQINAAVSGSALTVALKDANGLDPSSTSPVLIAFRDPTLTGGDTQIAAITAALSITAPAGASFGTANGICSKLWLVAFNNAGAVVLGLWQSVTGGGTPTNVATLDESSKQSPAAIGAGSTSPATFYAASALANVAFRVLGYIEFGTAQATAGQWVEPPTKIQVAGIGIRRPGDRFNPVLNSTTTVGSTSSATFAALSSGQSALIVVSSPANLVRAGAAGTVGGNTNGQFSEIQMARGSTLIGVPQSNDCDVSTGHTIGGVSLTAYDAPQTAGGVTYNIYGKASAGGTLSYPFSSTGSTLELEEIMT